MPKTTPHKDATVRFLLPTQETLEDDSSFVTSAYPQELGASTAYLQDWDGRWWSRSGTGDPGWNTLAHPSAAPANATSGHLYVPWGLSR